MEPWIRSIQISAEVARWQPSGWTQPTDVLCVLFGLPKVFFFFLKFSLDLPRFLNHRRSGLSASPEMLEDSAARGLRDDSWQEGVAAAFSEAWPSFTPVPLSPPSGLGHMNLRVLGHLCGQVRSQCWLIVTLE